MRLIFIYIIALSFLLPEIVNTGKPSRTLKINPDNPRYFTDGSSISIYLTGSHSWANIQERGYEGITPDFDFCAYLDFMKRYNHNFIRMWAWEHAAWMQFTDKKIRYKPLRYRRTGPGRALDGGLKFDLNNFNQEYFDRLRERVTAASEKGIYVSVMLFQGFSIEQKGTASVDPNKGNPWDGHPFNKNNNINGIDGDTNGDNEGQEVNTLQIPAITQFQETYIKKVIDVLNDLDNVIWEISNESHRNSEKWQYHMINFIKNYEKNYKPKQHPVLMTVEYQRGNNELNNTDLFNSPADAVSPNTADGYRNNPPAADGSKIIILDTDHLWGIGGNYMWVWKSFLRGHNPIFMDPYTDVRRDRKVVEPKGGMPDSKWDKLRRTMGHTLFYAKKINLTSMTPQNDLSSTKYCLANPGSEYLIYQPKPDISVTVNLKTGIYNYEWFNPVLGIIEKVGRITVKNGNHIFNAPFSGDAVLYLKSETN